MLRKFSGEFGFRNLNLKFVKQRRLVARTKYASHVIHGLARLYIYTGQTLCAAVHRGFISCPILYEAPCTALLYGREQGSAGLYIYSGQGIRPYRAPLCILHPVGGPSMCAIHWKQSKTIKHQMDPNQTKTDSQWLFLFVFFRKFQSSTIVHWQRGDLKIRIKTALAIVVRLCASVRMTKRDGPRPTSLYIMQTLAISGLHTGLQTGAGHNWPGFNGQQ